MPRLPIVFCLALLVFAPSRAAAQKAASPYNPALVNRLVADAHEHGDARRGAAIFRAPQFACLGCHKVGGAGGIVGPDLSKVGTAIAPSLIVEAVLWPKRQVKDEYKAISVTTTAGQVLQGYKERENDRELVLRDPATGKTIRLTKGDIEERREVGTLMPDGLADAMSIEQRRDLLRFLMELGKTAGLAELAADQGHGVAHFPLERAPLHPERWPHWQATVNQNRLYDFYAREADYFMKQPMSHMLLPEFPGLEGPKFSHWGSQDEKSWVDDRWSLADRGTLMCGVFRGAGRTITKAVCVRLGENGEMSACFNPETLRYEVVWRGGFVKTSKVRHGFLNGLLMDGATVERTPDPAPSKPFVYHGFYRHGKRVIFSYTIGDVKMLDAPWVENGKFVHLVAAADKHPLAKWTHGGAPQWPQELAEKGILGRGDTPYVLDTIPVPFDNPWREPIFCSGVDFLADGSALVCTMQGDVWRVSGLDDKLDKIRWRRVASGLHQSLGLKVSGDEVYVLGRDQITRLHDLDGDGEFDFYECFSSHHITSSSGHDYVCGLERDRAGNFYTASSKQGLLKISADGKKLDVIATGFRNPDGLGIYPDGAVTVPNSEGEWTPASMVCLVHPGLTPPPIGSPKSLSPELNENRAPYFGYGGPKNGLPPDVPMVYLPRGIDNSSGGQTYISSDRWGPLQGRMVHFSYGAGTHILLLRDEVDGQPQGAAVPLPGDFLAGVHRGRFNPRDGQLYAVGMGGWGTYTVDDGCVQRVRYTGRPVQLPNAFHVYQNGVLLTFTQPLKRALAANAKNYFAQAWNYRYSAGYGSPEFSPSHFGAIGHDIWTIAGAHVMPDGHSLFLEMPDLQPVNQLHLRLRVGGEPQDIFITIHKLDHPFTEIPNYRPVEKIIAAHPILADLRASTVGPPNPWRKTIAGARGVFITANKNLTFAQPSFTVRPGEIIRLKFTNPDAVPHNWVLLKPGSLAKVGDLANRLIANPDAVVQQYVPKAPEVLVYTDIVPPDGNFAIYFRAPMEKGRYPYLCTFPGHWMVMNGQMIVK